MARRLLAALVLALAALGFAAGPALACGGLVAPGHAEVLRKATTLAAWHDGFEHYVTGFQFAGSASRFGYIIPLPGNPTKIQKAGDWTLERLEREINPVRFLAAAPLASVPAPADRVQVLQRVNIEALDIVVVRGGGPDVAKWAEANGFDLTPDTPRVLGAYSSKGAVFALARFDVDRAARERLTEGQGIVIHFTIPTRAPWIPLRILALGKAPAEAVDADLFVLTDHRPWFAPELEELPGVEIRADDPADPQLLADLRSDRGMSWLPAGGMWFTAMAMHTTAGTIHDDLSIDGGGPPLAVAAARAPAITWPWWLVVGALMLAGVFGLSLLRPAPRPAT